MSGHPQNLVVIFDGDCLLCRRSIHWLEAQTTYVDVMALPAERPDVVAAYGQLPGYGENLVVVADNGRSWCGAPDAYLVVMWAVRGMRALSYLLSLGMLKPLATRVFRWVVGNRYAFNRVSAVMRPGCDGAATFAARPVAR